MPGPNITVRYLKTVILFFISHNVVVIFFKRYGRHYNITPLISNINIPLLSDLLYSIHRFLEVPIRKWLNKIVILYCIVKYIVWKPNENHSMSVQFRIDLIVIPCQLPPCTQLLFDCLYRIVQISLRVTKILYHRCQVAYFNIIALRYNNIQKWRNNIF